MLRLLVFSVLLASPSLPITRPSEPPEHPPAISVTVSVQDASGAPANNVLVIVQDLDHPENEMIRGLTDSKGSIPNLNLSGGLYRAIATTPYGLWQTRIREFLVSDAPVRVVLTVDSVPTHGDGDIVLVGAAHVDLNVVNPDGSPAVGAAILARDREATLSLERWYKTDRKGGVKVEVVAKPLVVVVVSGKSLVTSEFDSPSNGQVIHLPRP
jgi:hypothetical protein